MVELFSMLTMLIFLTLWGIGSLRKSGLVTGVPPLKTWLYSGGAVLMFSAVFALAIDPNGYYGLTNIPPRFNPSRQNTIEEYADLSYEPDILMLGSSRARNIDDTSAQEMMGLRLYNAAFNNGTTTEAWVFVRYLQQVGIQLPPVVVLEASLGAGTRLPQELGMFPYNVIPTMPTDLYLHATNQRLISLFSLGDFSEAWMSLFHYLNDAEDYPPDEFDIGGARHGQVDAPEVFQRIIRQAINDHRNAGACEGINPGLIEVLPKLIDDVLDAGSSIIIYLPTWQPDFYAAVAADNVQFQKCRTMHMDFYNELAAQPGVYAIDLAQPEDAAERLSGPVYFYDHQHANVTYNAYFFEQTDSLIRAALSDAQTRRGTIE